MEIAVPHRHPYSLIPAHLLIAFFVPDTVPGTKALQLAGTAHAEAWRGKAA